MNTLRTSMHVARPTAPGSRPFSRHASWAALAMMLLALTQCRTARTEIVVEIDTDADYGPGRTIETIEIQVQRPGGSQAVTEHWSVGATDQGLVAVPLSLTLWPVDQASAPAISVEVRGCGAAGCTPDTGAAGETEIVARVASSFVRGETRVLRVFLPRRCQAVSCPGATSCDAITGACVPSQRLRLPAIGDIEAPSGFAQIAAGGGMSCIRDASGSLECWGGGSDTFATLGVPGRVGSASAARRAPVMDIRDAIDVSVGYGHACAVIRDGSVRCWGRNDSGQIGDGSTTNHIAPFTVPDVANAVQVAAGGGFSCARLRDGAVMCWGRIESSTTSAGACAVPVIQRPQRIAGLDPAVQVSAGYLQACARMVDRSVRCWGGVAGATSLEGSVCDRPDAWQLAAVGGALEVGLGATHGCARLESGRVLCWGSDRHGQRGVRAAVTEAASYVDDIEDAVELSVGANHACVRRRLGEISCWGRNDSGQLGDRSTAVRRGPAAVLRVADAVAVAAGEEHSCARQSDGTIVCWGSDLAGQLGQDRALVISQPSLLAGLRADRISAGATQACALDRDAVQCWGFHGLGVDLDPVGPGGALRASDPEPVRTPGLESTPTQLALGDQFACSVMSDRSVRCWGHNTNGELGDGTRTARSRPTPVVGLSRVRMLRAGGSHVCAVLDDGALMCWGANGYGQLGDGAFADRSSPVLVPGVDDIADLRLGTEHTCVLQRDGQVRCWGGGRLGQLGHGVREQRSDPVRVELPRPAAALSCAYWTCCAVLVDTNVWCWGNNRNRQLGNPELPALDEPTPTQVRVSDGRGFSRILAVDVGAFGTYARGADGKVYGWGSVGLQLGLGGGFNIDEPVEMPRLLNAVDLAAGESHVCARFEDGSVKCAGGNGSGQLAQEHFGNLPGTNPVATVPLTEPSAELASGGRFSCSRDNLGRMACWGENSQGQLGVGLEPNPSTPQLVSGLTSVIQLAGGASHTCALRADGTVRCWGANAVGQCGDGTYTSRASPVAVLMATTSAELTGVVQLVAGDNHTCARRSDGKVFCWGGDAQSAAQGRPAFGPGPGLVPRALESASFLNATRIWAGGRATAVIRPACAMTPCSPPGGLAIWGAIAASASLVAAYPGVNFPVPPPEFSELAMSVGNICALYGDGRLACRGRNNYGQLGITGSEFRSAYEPIPGLPPVRAMALASLHLCAIDTAGLVWCWGSNSAGESGPMSVGSGPAAPQVISVADAMEITASAEHSCARILDGTVRCWGLNGVGQLGNGTYLDARAPTTVAGLNSVEQIVSGGASAHTCARLTDGTVRCWGQNGVGQLGAGSIGFVPRPTRVLMQASTVLDVRSGVGYACALGRDGGIDCWGENDVGQLGDASFNAHTTPAPVVGLPGRIHQFDVGLDHACAVAIDRSVSCWGRNESGQLGTMPDARQRGRAIAQVVPGVADVDQVAVGASHTCALRRPRPFLCVDPANCPTQAAAIFCWGDNRYGQLGRGDVQPHTGITTPADVGDAVQITAGGRHTCVRRSDGSVSCWGDNARGQVSGASPESVTSPQRVPELSRVAEIDAGTAIRCSPVTRRQTCGSAACSARAGIECVASGEDHTCARLFDGGVRCWGDNRRGQLGDGSTASARQPVAVAGLSGAVRIALGGGYGCAQSERGLVCWGDDTLGLVTAGAVPIVRAEPVLVPVALR